VILSVSVSAHSQPLPAAGARLVLTVHVNNATSCTFQSQRVPFSSLYVVKTVACASGHASVTVPAIANPYKRQVRLTYAVRVRGAGRQSVQQSVTVTEAAATSTSRPVPPATPPPVTPSPAPTPTLAILLVSVSTSVISASGGTVSVTVRATNAVTCTFSGEGISPLSVPCGSGSGGETITFVASNGPTVVYTYSVVAQDASGNTTVPRTFTVTQQGPPIPASLVGYLDVCTPGPDCFYGPMFATYQDYGNVAPVALGDCTFAAAAHWEQIVLGLNPDPTLIGFEFASAGGTTAGLTANALFAYWQHQGINGVFLTGLHSYFTDQTNVENGVRSYGAMIVAFQFANGGYFAQYQVSAGFHMAVVDGFTPEGPLVVSWGQTLQMTWAQWNSEVTGMWGIGTG
jgi:hypothetical protein